ncbi:MAG: hypothetical protein ABEJ79_06455 [Halolamina sp.]
MKLRSSEPRAEVDVPTGAWLLAGVPLAVSFVQTLMALFGYTSSAAGIKPIAEPVLSIPILYEAAVVFKTRSVIVMGLFVLIAGAWIAQGLSMRLFEHREATYGFATLAALLFFSLFFGVYSPLLGAEISAAQRLGFFLVPLVAAGAMLYAATAYDWSDVVLEEAGADLATVKRDLANVRQRFESAYETRFADLDALSDLAPEGVTAVREGRTEFEAELSDIADDVAAAQAGTGADEVSRRATELRETVASLDPVGRVDALDAAFRERLESGVRTTYGTVTIRSRYGDTYTLVNLPTELREADLPGSSSPVHVDYLADELIDAVRGDASISALADRIEAVESHLDDVRAHLDRAESEIADDIDTAEEELATAESQVEALRAGYAERVEEIAVDGRRDGLTGVDEVRDELDRAKEALHDCRAEQARALADDARAAAGKLVPFVEFVSTLSASIDHGHETVSIPDAVDTDAVGALAPAIEAANPAVEVAVDDGELRLRYGEGTASTESESDASDDAGEERDAVGTSETTDRRQSVAPASDVVDEVLYVFREFEDGAADEPFVQYDLSELPDTVATRDALVNVRRFAERQTDLFDDVELQAPEPPGFVEFDVSDGVSAPRAIKQTRRRFREKYA